MRKPQEKKWDVCPRIPEDINTQLIEYHPILRQVLFNRGITDVQNADMFLNAEKILHDPFLMKDMDIAVEKIDRAILDNKKIVVFGDYDADGVTATALLVQVLERMGANAGKYIPNRFDEGYGFSMDALEEVLKEKPNLLITVDCGVRSVEEVAKANQHGIEMIITDHHQPHDDQTPNAAAVVCPKQPGDEYPYKSLAGVGIAYKLAQAFQITHPGMNIDLHTYLDLVAIGTVADLAPLTEENRILVRKGIDCIRKGNRVGISALLKASSINNQDSFNARDIAFMIGPRLNAAGRLSTAETAYQLLMTQEQAEADYLADLLDRENQERQKTTKDIFQRVEEYFQDRDEEWLLFFADKDFNEGVVGLAASRLAERYYRPAIIGAIKGDTIRASCRSISELNITHALDRCADLLIKHGGHAMAAGLSMEKEKAGLFSARLSKVIQEQLAGMDLGPTMKAEMEVGLSQLNPTLIHFLDSLEPCGEGNPIPLFISRNVEVVRIKTMGKENDHIRMDVRSSIDDKNQQRITFSGVGFYFGWMAPKLKSGDHIDIIYSFGFNEYNGRKNPQLTIRDIKAVDN